MSKKTFLDTIADAMNDVMHGYSTFIPMKVRSFGGVRECGRVHSAIVELQSRGELPKYIPYRIERVTGGVVVSLSPE